MQEISDYLNKANKLIRTADHLTYVTYPLIKDNKLIITITENLADAMTNAINALLHYDKYYKRITYLPEDFRSRLEIFKLNCAPRYNISTIYLTLIRDLKDLQEARKKASMEFIRKDEYVITEKNFNIKTLTYQKAKDYVNLSKAFFDKVNFILKNVQTKRS